MTANNTVVTAVFPGSFDPVTFGHLDLIRRATRMFDHVMIGIGLNPEKAELFTPEQRLELLEPHLAQHPNVAAQTYSGLTIDFVRQVGGLVLLRGIRDVNDLSYEIRTANVNMLLGEIETVFMLTSDLNVMTSSTYIRQIYEMGGGDSAAIRRLVPENVVDALNARLGRS